MEQTVAPPPVTFEINPTDYKHWKLTVDGHVATLAMDVREDAGLRPHDYKLKLNSYDSASTSSSPISCSVSGRAP